MQLSLIPITLEHEEPHDPTSSADLKWVGWDTSGQRWALRTTGDPRPDAPMIEWFCYHLCQWCGVWQPEFGVVQRPNGELAFGSKWAENAWQYAPARTTQLQLESWLRDSNADISAMFVIDAFLPNDDRHSRNVLFEAAATRVRALAFDWSRARWFEPWPWDGASNSAQFLNWLKSAGLGPSSTAAYQCATRLKTLPSQTLKELLIAAPVAWRENMDIEAAAHWWARNAANRADAALGQLLHNMPP